MDFYPSKSRSVEFGDSDDIQTNNDLFALWEKQKQLTSRYPQRLFLTRTPAYTTIPTENPGMSSTPQWTLSFIAKQLYEQPRSQLNIYFNPHMLPAIQREAVAYRTVSKGHVRRSELSRDKGANIYDSNELIFMLRYDLQRYSDLSFTFMSHPTFGLTDFSEHPSCR